MSGGLTLSATEVIFTARTCYCFKHSKINHFHQSILNRTENMREYKLAKRSYFRMKAKFQSGFASCGKVLRFIRSGDQQT